MEGNEQYTTNSFCIQHGITETFNASEIHCTKSVIVECRQHAVRMSPYFIQNVFQIWFMIQSWNILFKTDLLTCKRTGLVHGMQIKLLALIICAIRSKQIHLNS